MDYGEAVYLLCLKSQEYYAELERAFEKNGEKWANEITDAVVRGRNQAAPELPSRPSFVVASGKETSELLSEFEKSYDDLKYSLTLELLNNIKNRLLEFAEYDDNIFRQWEARLRVMFSL